MQGNRKKRTSDRKSWLRKLRRNAENGILVEAVNSPVSIITSCQNGCLKEEKIPIPIYSDDYIEWTCNTDVPSFSQMLYGIMEPNCVSNSVRDSLPKIYYHLISNKYTETKVKEMGPIKGKFSLNNINAGGIDTVRLKELFNRAKMMFREGTLEQSTQLIEIFVERIVINQSSIVVLLNTAPFIISNDISSIECVIDRNDVRLYQKHN